MPSTCASHIIAFTIIFLILFSPVASALLLGDSVPQKYAISYEGVSGIPIERMLWRSGIYPVTGISIGDKHIDWLEAAYHSLWYIPVLLSDGNMSIFGHGARGEVRVETSFKPAYSTMDVAPTACEALGIYGDFDGKSLAHVNASQVIVIYVDALGLYRYQWARDEMVNVSTLGEPIVASSVYPSISNINAAAMATGALPERSGIDVWNNHTILAPTCLQLARRDNVSAAWVDSPSQTLNIGVIKVPDADGDGTADDEVMARAIAEHENGTRLLYVHLLQADRALHDSGPYSERSRKAIGNLDALVGKLLAHVKPGTLVILIADHGGHDIEGGKGDHGSLLPQDLLVPAFIRMYPYVN